MPKTIICDNGLEFALKPMFFWTKRARVNLHLIQPGKRWAMVRYPHVVLPLGFLLLSKILETAPLYWVVIAIALIVFASSPREQVSDRAEVSRSSSESGRHVHG